MMEYNRAVLQAILRSDFRSFVAKAFNILYPGQTFLPAWHVDALAYQLERVWRGEIRLLIVNMPPRSLKSLMVSVAFPAFLLGHDPTQRIICASYASDLANKFSNDFRALVNSSCYRELFPGTRIGAKDSESEIEFTRRGSRLATSVGGTLTGRGGNLAIIDDPLKAGDAQSEAKRNTVKDWYTNTLLSRLDDKATGAIIVVMQRVHMDDLTGVLLRRSNDWTVLSLPAIATAPEDILIGQGRVHHRNIGDVLCPEREPQSVLDRLQSELGSDLFAAQYQQQPIPPGGAMVKRSWPGRYTTIPEIARGAFCIQSWDTAAKGGPGNDWSVCTTWLYTPDQKWYLIDVWRGHVDYPALKAKVQELATRWNADQVLIEEAATAVALLQELKYKVRGLVGVRPERDKETRMAVASAKFEAGQVFLPESASWLPELEAELFSYPGGSHDDQIDSISQALNHVHSRVWIWAQLGRGA
jgi:predicted phage terminase large subunit-like protein